MYTYEPITFEAATPPTPIWEILERLRDHLEVRTYR